LQITVAIGTDDPFRESYQRLSAAV